MRVKSLTLKEWEILERAASITTPFHDVAWFELILSSLGGELDQYLCEFDGQRWLVPCFSNGPWGEKSFRIGSIGYGGPVPLFDCPTPEAMVAGSLRAIRAVAQKRNQVCLAASVFPLSTWGGLEESALCGGHCVSTSIIYADQSPEETFDNDIYKQRCANNNGFIVIIILQTMVYKYTNEWQLNILESI